jgi:large-conductance mechanosensitive channel
MKISGKGIIVIIVFLILIPFLVDLFFATAFPDTKLFDFSMTKSFAGEYLQLIPSYIGYLIIAFAVLYLIKTKWRKSDDKENKDDGQLPNKDQNAQVSDTTDA